MRSNRKNPGAPEKMVRVSRALKRGASGDRESRKLNSLSKKLGNSALDANIQGNTRHRDACLQFIMERLQKVQYIQNQELLEMKDERDWYKDVAKGVSGYHLPDPTRWHEAAHVYKHAVQSLVNGNLGQGARLLERAVTIEQATFKTVPIQVQSRLDTRETGPAGGPDEIAHINQAAACPRTKAPEQLKLVARILNVQAVMDDAPPIQFKRRPQWWDLEEDEDEEEEDE